MKSKFYYLHEKGTQLPKDESKFPYICYVDEFSGDRIMIPNDEIEYCAHVSMGTILRWNWHDEELQIEGQLGSIRARFKKIYDIPGFTIWKNISA